MSKLLSDGLNNLLHAGLVNSQLMEPIFFVFSFRNGNVGSDPLGQVFLPHGKAVVPKRNGNGVHFGSIFHCNPLLIGVENNTQRNDAWTHEFLFCCWLLLVVVGCFWEDIQTFRQKRKDLRFFKPLAGVEFVIYSDSIHFLQLEAQSSRLGEILVSEQFKSNLQDISIIEMILDSINGKLEVLEILRKKGKKSVQKKKKKKN